MVDEKLYKQFARNRFKKIRQVEKQKKGLYEKLVRFSNMKLTDKNKNSFSKVLSEVCDFIQNYQDYQLLENNLKLELYDKQRETLFKSRRKERSRIGKIRKEIKIRLGKKNKEEINAEIQQRVNDFASEYDSADTLLNNLGEVIGRSRSVYQAELETLGKTVYTTISSFKKPFLTKSSEFEESKNLLRFRVENQIESIQQAELPESFRR